MPETTSGSSISTPEDFEVFPGFMENPQGGALLWLRAWYNIRGIQMASLSRRAAAPLPGKGTFLVPRYSVWVRNYSVKFKCPATR